MTSILFAGECMLELRKADAVTYRRGFAGDTYNSAVYAKLWSEDLAISFFTAIGQDSISEEMLSHWKESGLDCSQVLRSPDKLPGIYAIDVDENGERSFAYWRSQSAATSMMALLDGRFESLKNEQYDFVYVSGISMAILNDADKQALADLLAVLKGNGARIAYDPNCRLKMWRSNDHARYWNDVAYSISDIVFPGDEDHKDLYGHMDRHEILAYLEKFPIGEIVLKCGGLGVYGYNDFQEVAHVPFCPAPVQVDSTAAGDSFAGTYLASRASKVEIGNSIASAMGVAAFVVQHQGAIAPFDAYQQFKDSFEGGRLLSL